VAAGLLVPTDAIAVNGSTVSHDHFNEQLAAIGASPSWQCYQQALAVDNRLTEVPSTVTGVSPAAWATTLAVQWSDTRVHDLAVEGYVRQHDPAALAPAALPAAQASLEAAITSTIESAYQSGTASGQQFTCTKPAAGAATLASMPSWFQQEQVTAEAANLALAHLVPTVIPESGPGLEAWFNEHRGQFATVCFSLIQFSDPSTAEAVAAEIAQGTITFAEAAKKYSEDTTTGAKGGAYGCVPATSSIYQTVRSYVGDVPTGGTSQLVPIESSSGSSYLLFRVTHRDAPPTFEAVKAAVVSAAVGTNRTSAELLSAQINRQADVAVAPTIGTWLPLPSAILPPTAPPDDAVHNAAANTPAAPAASTPGS
jgi:PPIC-type PPIASE domain